MVSIETEKSNSENQGVSNDEQETNLQREDTLPISNSDNNIFQNAINTTTEPRPRSECLCGSQQLREKKKTIHI
jgi:hypothetical protein